MEKQYIYIGIIILIIIIGFVIGTYSPKSTDEVKIGVVLPLTGAQNYLGEYHNNGVQLALDDYYNQSNHKNIKLLTEDSAGTPQQGLSSVNKLISADKVDYFFVSLTAVISATSATISSNKIPTIIVTPAVTLSSKNNYLYNFYFYLKDYGTRMGEQLTKEDINNVAIYVYNIDSADDFIDSFQNSYSNNIVSVDKLNVAQMDFKTEIIKAKTSNANTILFINFANPTIIFLNQMIELDVNIPVYILDGNYDTIKSGAKDSLTKLDVHSGWLILVPDKYDSFVAGYKAKYNKSPEPSAAYTYNSMKIMLEVIDKCGKDKVCFNNEIMTTTFVGGVVKDSITFDENRNAIIGSDLIQYDGNKQEWVKLE